MRSPKELIGEAPVAPSDEAETGARELSAPEVEQLTEDFIAAAVRAQKAGFDGAELHGAHGYILCQFLSAQTNRRTDRWGGTLENRTRIIRDIIAAAFAAAADRTFKLGLRLSPERFGLKLAGIRDFAGELMRTGDLDFLDMSLWDVFKEPVEPEFQGRSLMSYFTELDRRKTRLGVAGKIIGGDEAVRALNDGVDFVIIGRSAVLHHDFPKRVEADPHFRPVSLPVSRTYLAAEGLSPKFVTYMSNWKGFVAEEPALEAQAS